jgi:hypothetical protein
MNEDQGRGSTLVGLALGAVVGGVMGGWTGAFIGGYVMAYGGGDLLAALWQMREARMLLSIVQPYGEAAEALAIGRRGLRGLCLCGLGAICGAVLGYLLGNTGFSRALGVFVGMALGGAVASLIAKTFTRVKTADIVIVGLARLTVSAVVWGVYSLWANPLGMLLGIVAGVAATGLVGTLLFWDRPGF